MKPDGHSILPTEVGAAAAGGSAGGEPLPPSAAALTRSFLGLFGGRGRSSAAPPPVPAVAAAAAGGGGSGGGGAGGRPLPPSAAAAAGGRGGAGGEGGASASAELEAKSLILEAVGILAPSLIAPLTASRLLDHEGIKPHLNETALLLRALITLTERESNSRGLISALLSFVFIKLNKFITPTNVWSVLTEAGILQEFRDLIRPFSGAVKKTSIFGKPYYDKSPKDYAFYVTDHLTYTLANPLILRLSALPSPPGTPAMKRAADYLSNRQAFYERLRSFLLSYFPHSLSSRDRTDTLALISTVARQLIPSKNPLEGNPIYQRPPSDEDVWAHEQKRQVEIIRAAVEHSEDPAAIAALTTLQAEALAANWEWLRRIGSFLTDPTNIKLAKAFYEADIASFVEFYTELSPEEAKTAPFPALLTLEPEAKQEICTQLVEDAIGEAITAYGYDLLPPLLQRNSLYSFEAPPESWAIRLERFHQDTEIRLDILAGIRGGDSHLPLIMQVSIASLLLKDHPMVAGIFSDCLLTFEPEQLGRMEEKLLRMSAYLKGLCNSVKDHLDNSSRLSESHELVKYYAVELSDKLLVIPSYYQALLTNLLTVKILRLQQMGMLYAHAETTAAQKETLYNQYKELLNDVITLIEEMTTLLQAFSPHTLKVLYEVTLMSCPDRKRFEKIPMFNSGTPETETLKERLELALVTLCVAINSANMDYEPDSDDYRGEIYRTSIQAMRVDLATFCTQWGLSRPSFPLYLISEMVVSKPPPSLSPDVASAEAGAAGAAETTPAPSAGPSP